MSEPRPGDNLLSKSKLFGELAKQHHDKEKYAAVPHLAYYSCLMAFKAILFQDLQMTEESILITCPKKRSHEAILTLTLNYLKSLTPSAAVIVSLRRYFKRLKTLRVEADYRDSLIKEERSEEALSHMSAIQITINQYDEIRQR